MGAIRDRIKLLSGIRLSVCVLKMNFATMGPSWYCPFGFQLKTQKRGSSLLLQLVFLFLFFFLTMCKPTEQIRQPFFGQTPAIGCYSQHFCMDAVKCLSILFKRMNGFGFPWLNAKCAPKKGAERRKNISIHLIKCLEIVAKL